MCGICGINVCDGPLILKMTDTLEHRGRDAKGTYTAPKVSLGHRRLSIIDLSSGGQPMSFGDLVIVFNGEIYNYREVRDELVGLGHVFNTSSDTEVILHAYQAWGAACVRRFNGMWAFCIYNAADDSFFCSRDRVGKKPFYYYWAEGKFVFGSEIKALHAAGIPTSLRKDFTDYYFTMGYIPAPLTCYNEIAKLPAGCSLFIKNNQLTVKRYYTIPNYKPTYDYNALCQQTKELMVDATNARLVSDVPVGAFLSGGLDSSTIVACMAQGKELSKLHTYSIGFEGTYDESEYITVVKDYLGTIHHHEYFTRQNYESLLGTISYYYDEPFGDWSNFPTYTVSALARQNITVALSGDGGDEIFGGYTMHQIAARIALLQSWVPRIVRKALFNLMPRVAPTTFIGGVREALKLSVLPLHEFYAEMGSDHVYKPASYKRWARVRMKRLLKSCDNNLVEAVIRFDICYNTLSDNFLTKVDRASMANGVEVRSPFLDYRFLNLESKIPSKWKTTPFKTKVLMREAIKDLLPQKITKRGKMGFTPPIAEWINNHQTTRELYDGLVTLHNQKIIPQPWYEFYQQKVLFQKDPVYVSYRIRLLLLIKWYEQWVAKIEE